MVRHEYTVGMRVKHRLFGAGEIKELARITNGVGHRGFAATIHFDEGGTKGIGLPDLQARSSVAKQAGRQKAIDRQACNLIDGCKRACPSGPFFLYALTLDLKPTQIGGKSTFL
jgi:hypothetical protein